MFTCVTHRRSMFYVIKAPLYYEKKSKFVVKLVISECCFHLFLHMHLKQVTLNNYTYLDNCRMLMMVITLKITHSNKYVFHIEQKAHFY